MDEHQADEALAFAAREDQAAFAQLYRRYADSIYRYLLTQVSDPPDAQDLTAQTFAAALRTIDRYRAEGSLAAWLTIIARNQAVNFYRRRRREVPLDDDTPLNAPADRGNRRSALADGGGRQRLAAASG